MTRIVLDTNVLVSGLLSPYGTCAEIVAMVMAEEVVLCFDTRIIIEYREVLLRPKFGFDKRHVGDVLAQCEAAGQSVSARPLAKMLTDRDDMPFIEVALTAKADCLITGNVKDFHASACEGMKVFLPTEFLAYYRKHKRHHGV